jgi:hypothetical protein
VLLLAQGDSECISAAARRAPPPTLSERLRLGEDVYGDGRHEKAAEREPAPLSGSGIGKLLVSLERPQDASELSVVAD